MSGFNYANLVTDIRNYTEVGDSVLTAAIINRFIEDAEFRIFYDVPIDAYRFVSEGQLVADDNNINVISENSSEWFGKTLTIENSENMYRKISKPLDFE